MEVTFHLPVSLIANLISHTLGGQTRLELCKNYRYADLDGVFTVPYRKIAVSVHGRDKRRLHAGGVKHRKPVYHG